MRVPERGRQLPPPCAGGASAIKAWALALAPRSLLLSLSVSLSLCLSLCLSRAPHPSGKSPSWRRRRQNPCCPALLPKPPKSACPLLELKCRQRRWPRRSSNKHRSPFRRPLCLRKAAAANLLPSRATSRAWKAYPCSNLHRSPLSGAARPPFQTSPTMLPRECFLFLCSLCCHDAVALRPTHKASGQLAP